MKQFRLLAVLVALVGLIGVWAISSSDTPKDKNKDTQTSDQKQNDNDKDADTDSQTAVEGDTTTGSTSSTSTSNGTTNGQNNFVVRSASANTTPPVTPPTPVPQPPVTYPNLVENPSAEAEAGAPSGWLQGGWGTNDRTFSYDQPGRSGGRSLSVSITSHTDGDAKWYFAPVALESGKLYRYSDWYKSDVDTQLLAVVEMADGTIAYYQLGTAFASSDWKQATGSFMMPAGAVSATVFHTLAKVGTLHIDDVSLTEYHPAPLQRALVSLTFDDTLASVYNNALPLLNQYGYSSTQYILTGTIDQPDSMTADMIQAFKDQGHEIAAHTVTHTDLTTLDEASVDAELGGAQADLQTEFGTDAATSFASPYGAYNEAVLAQIKAYYASHRSVDTGLNTLDDFDPYNIKVQNVLATTTPEEVQAWVDQAVATNTWLVLVYHGVEDSVDPAVNPYATTPIDLEAHLNAIEASGVSVVTVGEAVAEITAQQ